MLTPNTTTDSEELGKELRDVREQSHVYDYKEAELKLCCMAACKEPLRRVVASMSLSVPDYRYEDYEEKYRGLVGSTKEVAKNLGYTKVEYPSRTTRRRY